MHMAQPDSESPLTESCDRDRENLSGVRISVERVRGLDLRGTG